MRSVPGPSKWSASKRRSFSVAVAPPSAVEPGLPGRDRVVLVEAADVLDGLPQRLQRASGSSSG